MSANLSRQARADPLQTLAATATMPVMNGALQSRRVKLLHSVGYVCTALVALELVVVAVPLTKGFFREQALRVKLREETRTREGAMQNNDHLGARIPSAAQLGRDSARMFA